MKKGLLLAAMLVFFGMAPSPSPAAVPVEGDVYLGYNDKYLWRGFDLSGGKHVLQPGADLSFGGFTASIWNSFDLETEKSTEIDITLDYSFGVKDLLSVSVGNIFYGMSGLEDTNEAYLILEGNTFLSPTLEIYYDYDQAESDGLFYLLSVGRSFELAKGVDLNLGASVSYNQASDYSIGPYRNWHNYEGSASLDYALTDQFTVTPAFVFSSPLSAAAKEAIDTETMAGFTVKFSF